MRAVIKTGGNVGTSDKDCRDGVREIATERCAGCGEDTPIGALVLFGDDAYDVDCAVEAALNELYPPIEQLQEELRGVQSAAAVARRRERAELNGESLVRGSSETLD